MNEVIPNNINLDTVWVVIPAYNEDAAIGKVLERLKEDYLNVVVVDDASTDDTPSVARAAGVELVQQPFRQASTMPFVRKPSSS